MAGTIRCPVCGTPNPDDQERCSACNQRLNQSTDQLNGFGERIASGQTPTEQKTAELEKALPAWLRHARQTDQDDLEESPAEIPDVETEAENLSAPDPEAEDEEEEPIFLDFLAEENDEQDAEEVSPTDWLAGLSESAEDDAEDEEDDAADWLKNLQGDLPPETSTPEEPQTEESPALQAAPEEDASLDWMDNLQDDRDSQDALPDLLPQEKSGFSAPNDDFDAEDLPGEDGTPDWLSRLSAEAETDETLSLQPDMPPVADAQPVAAGEDDDLPDWMKSLQSAGEVEDVPSPVARSETSTSTESPAVPADDLPDWMGELQAAAETPTSEESPAAEPAPVDDLPDWLAGDDASTETSAVPADDLPDWMGDLQAAAETPASEEAPAAEPAPADDLPDWLSNLQAEDVGEVADEAKEDVVAFAAETSLETSDDLSDSLGGLGADDSGDTADEAQPETVTAPAFDADMPLEGADGLPDWLSDLAGGDETESASQQVAEPLAETSEKASASPFAGLDLPEDGDLPDWISRMGKPTTGSLSADDLNDAELAPALEAADEAPAWLDSLPGIDDVDVEKTEETASALASNPAFVMDDNADDEEIFGIDMPDWLSNLAPEDLDTVEDVAEVDAAATSSDDLSDAELPSWVQAMRPVESVVASSDADEQPDIEVVDSGPLAGLPGILPLGNRFVTKHKPQSYSMKLRVNASQQRGAELLENILEREGQVTADVSNDAPASIPLLRWLVAALMLVVVLFGLLSPQTISPSPDVIVPEVGDTLDVVNELPDSGTVLVIFDYEAALSAELQVVAAPIVEHITLRGQKLALLASSPNGPALAERFLTELETQSGHVYERGAEYVNLGYLPGGATGMLSFINDPRNAVAGALDGKSFWEYAPLADIQAMTDFSAVLILTDDVERGRAWIEQSAAQLDAANTPLLMGVSAQAEPIIYPYYASAQVDGLVSGLNGGATYEVLLGRNGLGRDYWDAYSFGLLTAEILIVIGAILSFLAGVRARRQVATEAE